MDESSGKLKLVAIFVASQLFMCGKLVRRGAVVKGVEHISTNL